MKATEIIEKFCMKPLPLEGGYYCETYRSHFKLNKDKLDKEYSGDRCYSTAIYYLLDKGQKSLLHRLKSDEIWHFYYGDPINLLLISPKGEGKTITLGNKIVAGHTLQQVIPSGYWFGAYLPQESNYALLGCTVSPGFEFEDFELGCRQELLNQFPQLHNLVLQLTI